MIKIYDSIIALLGLIAWEYDHTSTLGLIGVICLTGVCLYQMDRHYHKELDL